MPATISIGLFVLDGILILIGILGGKFKVFGAEVAEKISNRFLRFIAVIFDTIMVIGAIVINSNSASGTLTTWTCYVPGGDPVGNVFIEWGHTKGDAEWTCNHWKPECGNGGGCTATKISK